MSAVEECPDFMGMLICVLMYRCLSIMRMLLSVTVQMVSLHDIADICANVQVFGLDENTDIYMCQCTGIWPS